MKCKEEGNRESWIQGKKKKINGGIPKLKGLKERFRDLCYIKWTLFTKTADLHIFCVFQQTTLRILGQMFHSWLFYIFLDIISYSFFFSYYDFEGSSLLHLFCIRNWAYIALKYIELFCYVYRSWIDLTEKKPIDTLRCFILSFCTAIFFL